MGVGGLREWVFPRLFLSDFFFLFNGIITAIRMFTLNRRKFSAKFLLKCVILKCKFASEIRELIATTRKT